MDQKEIMKQAMKSAGESGGIRFIDAADGYARAELELRPEHLNFMRIVYGGTLYHLADVTAGIAFMSAGGLGATITGDMQFLSGAKNTDRLLCEAQVSKNGRRVCFVQSVIKDEQGKVLAMGNFTFCNNIQ